MGDLNWYVEYKKSLVSAPMLATDKPKKFISQDLVHCMVIPTLKLAKVSQWWILSKKKCFLANGGSKNFITLSDFEVGKTKCFLGKSVSSN